MESSDLKELEPSPVEETPSHGQDEYFSSQASSSTSTSSVGLSQHSPAWYLTRIQKWSAIAFSAFSTAHIVNTSIIPLITQSVPASEPYLLLTRPYYQSYPIAEPVLVIAPLVAHVGSGLALRLYRARVNAKRYGAETRAEKRAFSTSILPRVSGISKLGFLSNPLLLGHIFINRYIPSQYPGGSSNINLSYVSHAFAKHPITSFAGFAALITAVVFHSTWGMAKYLQLTPEYARGVGVDRELYKKRRWYIINGVAAAATALWMAGSFGVIGTAGQAPGWVGSMYDEMFRKIPIFGRWS